VDVITTTADFWRMTGTARRRGRSVGLVPTMGALHAGHRSLVDRAVAECDEVVVSIFVNPLQFGDPEDLRCYPRTLDEDLSVCARAGASAVFAPTVAEMYPSWPAPPPSTVVVGDLGDRWEGASRPGHFNGVTTVVAKLFAMVGACRAYFGEKDFQQLAIVRTMAQDLCFPVEVVGCPIVREDDGLAMSSRNVRLSPAERQAATVLSRALEAGCDALERGWSDPEAVAGIMGDVVRSEPLAHLDYATVVTADLLDVPDDLAPGRQLRLLVAAGLGAVRLIDNCAPRAHVAGRSPRRTRQFLPEPIGAPMGLGERGQTSMEGAR
jgi:pantoate--beta-alanine ligase